MHESKQELPPKTKSHLLQQTELQPIDTLNTQGICSPQRDSLMRIMSSANNTSSVEVHAAMLSHSATSWNRQFLLQLQQQYGNQYVQQVLASAKQDDSQAQAETLLEVDNTTQDRQALNNATQGQITSGFSNFQVPETASTQPSKINIELQPHQAPDSTLRTLAPIYKEGKTPFIDLSGNLHTFDIEPANAVTTGHQLEQIQQNFGVQGLEQTIHGLTLTRGTDFVVSALQEAPTAVRYASSQTLKTANVDSETDETLFSSKALTSPLTQTQSASESQKKTVGGTIASLLSHSATGQALPLVIRGKFAKLAGDNLADVRIYNDSAAHTAAGLLGARAFTIGRSIYFAAGEFSPWSHRGIHLLAHEVAHTVQQRGATMPAPQELQVSTASDLEETSAERFADAAVGLGAKPPSLSLTHSAGVARVQRAISFTHSNDSFTKNTMGVGESATGFQIRPNAFPLFQWTSDITIHGNPGDPFANFEVGPHQIVRSFHHNIFWGTGTNRTHRSVSLSTLPIRDATAAGNTWYHDPLARSFSVRGETQNTGLDDSPQSALVPWDNPVAGRTGNSGSFNYGVAFVAYISARDTTRGTGAAAFRAIGNVYWNTAVNGTFNASRAIGSRVAASGGTLNRSGVISGGSAEFPSMHGGSIANDSVSVTDT